MGKPYKSARKGLKQQDKEEASFISLDKRWYTLGLFAKKSVYKLKMHC